MKTPRRRRQLKAWVRWNAEEHRVHSEHYFAKVKQAADVVSRMVCADSAQDTRAAAAHMLRCYRKVRGSVFTNYLISIRFIMDHDDGRDMLTDPLVFHSLGILKDVEQDLLNEGEDKDAGYAFDICSDGFHHRVDLAIELVDLILVERSIRLQKKLDGKVPPEGLRVRMRNSIDRYPHFMFSGDHTGTVCHDEYVMVVKVDQDFPGGEDWGNEVQYQDGYADFWDEWEPLTED